MLFHLLWRMGTIVRNSFSAVVYTACNIMHTIEKHIAELAVSSENFFPLVLHERAPLTVYYWDYTPFAQNGTSYNAVVLYKVKRRHCYCTPCSVCKRDKFDQFNISLYKNIPSQYDIVSMAKRFHFGFYAKCTKSDEIYMCYICRLEKDALWATSWQNQQNDFCAQRTLRSAWASAQSDQSSLCAQWVA